MSHDADKSARGLVLEQITARARPA